MKTARLQVSVLVTAYRRPHQLREALESIAAQDQSLIGEIVIGDDSPPKEAAANFAEVQRSGLGPNVRYFANSPAKGCYPNHWFLAEQARFDHLVFLHDDDHFCPGALAALIHARENETDSSTQIWFGRNLLMDEQGTVDVEGSKSHNARYGRGGEGAVKPMWEWCMTQSVTPNTFLVSTEVYRRYMRGERDGNVGDWGFVVRLANSGASGRFLPVHLMRYRIQAASSTSSGRGMDVHRWFELLQQLNVPPDAERQKFERWEPAAVVAVIRYARDGERLRAWRCFLSPNWSWRRRLSLRGVATLGVLLTPRFVWHRLLRFRD